MGNFGGAVMKKKILAVITAAVIAVSMFTGISAFYAASSFDYTPNTPIEFHDMNKIMFMETSFSTKKSPQLPAFTDDWKYYYWCDFMPQYTADYTVDVGSQFRMKCEIYDADNNLIAVENSNPEKGEDRYYHFTLTHRLTERNQYYYKFAFTEGNFDTVGRFLVLFTSNGSDKVPDADWLHLYINGSSTAYTYELEEYSVQKLFQDLEFIVVYKNGKFSKWVSRETPMMALDGVDILLNSSDCTKTVGKHTLIAHYLGYEVKATFNIVECIHKYKLENIEYPQLKTAGCYHYKCEKCGDEKTEYTLTAEELRPLVEKSLNTKYGDSNYDKTADINQDGAVNARDVAIILKAYEGSSADKVMKGNGISQSF